MSTRRDLLWYRSAKGTHFTGIANLAGGTIMVESITANASRSVDGFEPVDAHLPMKGIIEHIGVIIGGATSVQQDIDIVVFSGSGAAGTNADVDAYVDHESFATGDFINIDGDTIWRAAKSGLKLPYTDKDGTKKFHIGVLNASATAITYPDNMVIEWCWRPDLGE
jgi:hypothetical protein